MGKVRHFWPQLRHFVTQVRHFGRQVRHYVKRMPHPLAQRLRVAGILAAPARVQMREEDWVSDTGGHPIDPHRTCMDFLGLRDRFRFGYRAIPGPRG